MKLSYFEQAGFNKSMAMKLENLCIEYSIPYEKMLKVISDPNPDIYMTQKDIDELYSALYRQ